MEFCNSYTAYLEFSIFTTWKPVIVRDMQYTLHLCQAGCLSRATVSPRNFFRSSYFQPQSYKSLGNFTTKLRRFLDIRRTQRVGFSDMINCCSQITTANLKYPYCAYKDIEIATGNFLFLAPGKKHGDVSPSSGCQHSQWQHSRCLDLFVAPVLPGSAGASVALTLALSLSPWLAVRKCSVCL